MSDQQQQQKIEIGFQVALDQFYPEWQTEWSQAQVDQARFFYSSAMQHVGLLMQTSAEQLAAVARQVNDNVKQLSANTDQAVAVIGQHLVNLVNNHNAVHTNAQLPQSKDEIKRRKRAEAVAAQEAAALALAELDAEDKVDEHTEVEQCEDFDAGLPGEGFVAEVEKATCADDTDLRDPPPARSMFKVAVADDTSPENLKKVVDDFQSSTVNPGKKSPRGSINSLATVDTSWDQATVDTLDNKKE